MLSLLAFLVCTTSAYTLTCHCLNGSSCQANGFCAEGCENGWYGPGCQVGNVALGKPAQQSTTYTGSDYLGTADRAVDGSVPSNESHVYCTHTAAYRQSAWWVVTLDTTHDYVIINVTLVNRKGDASYRLANFVILYSNETNSSDPNPTDTTWHEFAREDGTVGVNRTYKCNSTVIAKRVAVFLTAFPVYYEGILTLCEVQIYGYEHRDCAPGFTGPGCLLRACDQCHSTIGNCTGDFHSCSYHACPDASLLPPDCWISVLEPLATSPAPEANVAVIAGSVGGSIALFIIIMAIVAAVYCRRKKNSTSQASASLGNKNAAAHSLADAQDETRRSSSNIEKCDNVYESLQTDVDLRTAGDYDSLTSST